MVSLRRLLLYLREEESTPSRVYPSHPQLLHPSFMSLLLKQPSPLLSIDHRNLDRSRDGYGGVQMARGRD